MLRVHKLTIVLLLLGFHMLLVQLQGVGEEEPPEHPAEQPVEQPVVPPVAPPAKPSAEQPAEQPTQAPAETPAATEEPEKSYAFYRVDPHKNGFCKYFGFDSNTYIRYEDWCSGCANESSVPLFTLALQDRKIVGFSSLLVKLAEGHYPGIILHRTGGRSCHTKISCKLAVRTLKRLYDKKRNGTGIPWNFIVAPHGNDYFIFEGKGFEMEGTAVGQNATYNENSKHISVAFMGHFYDYFPNPPYLAGLAAIRACFTVFISYLQKQLIDLSLSLNFTVNVANRVEIPLYTHSQTHDPDGKECPGRYVEQILPALKDHIDNVFRKLKYTENLNDLREDWDDPRKLRTTAVEDVEVKFDLKVLEKVMFDSKIQQVPYTFEDQD